MEAAGGRIRIGGVKLSDELLKIGVWGSPQGRSPHRRLCRLLAEHRINMQFLTVTLTDGVVRTCGCVAAEDESEVRTILESEPLLEERTELVPGVGLLSVFPHEYSLELFGLLLRLFSEAELPVHGMCSSISSLSFVTQYGEFDRALEVLNKCCDLPPDHAPMRPELRVRQR